MTILEDVDVQVHVDFGNGYTRIDFIDDGSGNNIGHPLRTLGWDRGRRARKLGPVETSELTALLDNRTGNLLPDNDAGTWYPNVVLGRPIRVDIIEHSVTYTVFTGEIGDIDPDWDQADSWVTITAYGKLSPIARTDLPDSLFAYEAALAGPVGWWPLSDTIPGVVEARIGSDGTTSGEPQTGAASLLDLEPHTTGMSFLDKPQSRVELGPDAALTGPQGAIEVWFECIPKPAGTSSRHHYLWRQYAGSPYFLDFINFFVRGAGTGVGLLEAFIADGTNPALTATVAGAVRLDDGIPHHAVMAWAQTATDTLMTLYVDGYTAGSSITPGLISPGAGDVFVSNRETVVAVGDGWQVNGRVQHVVAYDEWPAVGADVFRRAQGGSVRFGTDGNGAGETTGERIERILDVIGSTEPRAIDVGVETCGPAILRGERASVYIQRVVATEGPDAWFYAGGDATLTFLAAGAAVPAFPAIDSSDQFGNVPYRDATPRYDGARTVDTVRINREGGLVQTASFSTADSEEAAKTIDTVHETAAAAAAAAEEYLSVFSLTRMDLEAAELQLESGLVPWPEALAVAPGWTVEVIGRPPGASVLDLLAVVTYVSHKIDFRSLTWRLTLNAETDYREPSNYRRFTWGRTVWGDPNHVWA